MTFGWKDYFHNKWNVIDLFGYGLVILSSVLRLAYQLDWARGSYCVAIVVLSARFLQVFIVSKYIGPQVFMIKMMVRIIAVQFSVQFVSLEISLDFIIRYATMLFEYIGET